MLRAPIVTNLMKAMTYPYMTDDNREKIEEMFHTKNMRALQQALAMDAALMHNDSFQYSPDADAVWPIQADATLCYRSGFDMVFNYSRNGKTSSTSTEATPELFMDMGWLSMHRFISDDSDEADAEMAEFVKTTTFGLENENPVEISDYTQFALLGAAGVKDRWNFPTEGRFLSFDAVRNVKDVFISEDGKTVGVVLGLFIDLNYDWNIRIVFSADEIDPAKNMDDIFSVLRPLDLRGKDADKFLTTMSHLVPKDDEVIVRMPSVSYFSEEEEGSIDPAVKEIQEMLEHGVPAFGEKGNLKIPANVLASLELAAEGIGFNEDQDNYFTKKTYPDQWSENEQEQKFLDLSRLEFNAFSMEISTDSLKKSRLDYFDKILETVDKAAQDGKSGVDVERYREHIVEIQSSFEEAFKIRENFSKEIFFGRN